MRCVNLFTQLLDSFTRLFGTYFTEVFSLLIILLALAWYIIYDILKLGLIDRSLKKLNDELAGLSGHGTGNILKLNKSFNAEGIDKAISNSWSMYYEDFIKSGRQERAPEISDYFTLERIITIPARRKWAEIVPGILILAGVLAAMLGMLSSLRNIGTGIGASQADPALRQSVGDLLGSVSPPITIFIVAVLCALVFQLLDRSRYQSAVIELSRFLENMARRIPMSDESSLFELLLNEQKIQNEKLEHLGKDISSEIAKYVSDEFAPTLNNTFVQAVQSQMLPIVNEIKRSVQKMSEETVELQTEGINRLAESFADRLNSVAGSEFRELAANIKSLGEEQKKAEKSIKILLDEIARYIEYHKKAYKEAINVLESIQSYQKQAEASNLMFSENMAALTRFNEQIKESLSADKESFEKLNLLREATIQENREYLEKMDNQVTRLMEELNTQLDMAFMRFNDATVMAFERLDNTMSASVEGITSSIKTMLDNLDDRVRDITLYAKGLSEEVAALNERLESSVRVFGNHLKQGVVKTLETFDEGLAELSDRFGNVITDIRDSVEDLPKVLENYTRRE